MARLQTVLVWVVGLILLLLALLVLEASGGHDGYLCEWGYDKDGDGAGVSGCG